MCFLQNETHENPPTFASLRCFNSFRVQILRIWKTFNGNGFICCSSITKLNFRSFSTVLFDFTPMPSANAQAPTASTSGTHIPTWTGNNAQADDWIKNGLGITDQKTIDRLKSQGISTPADLFELEEDDITALSNAMSSKVYNDDGTVAAKPCTLHWRQLKRIRNYAALADYCSTVRRNIHGRTLCVVSLMN